MKNLNQHQNSSFMYMNNPRFSQNQSQINQFQPELQQQKKLSQQQTQQQQQQQRYYHPYNYNYQHSRQRLIDDSTQQQQQIHNPQEKTLTQQSQLVRQQYSDMQLGNVLDQMQQPCPWSTVTTAKRVAVVHTKTCPQVSMSSCVAPSPDLSAATSQSQYNNNFNHYNYDNSNNNDNNLNCFNQQTSHFLNNPTENVQQHWQPMQWNKPNRQQLQLELHQTSSFLNTEQRNKIQQQYQLQQQQQQQQQQLQQHSLKIQAEHQRRTQYQNENKKESPLSEKFTMDACEIANFLANELFMQQLASIDGIQSGVPTLTTSTLTPTTLRSIEESFIQLTSEPVNAPYQAGFIPPPLASFPSTSTNTSATNAAFTGSIHDFNDNNDTESENSQTSWNGQQYNEDNSMATTDTSSAATDSTSFQNGFNGVGNNSLTTSNASSTNDFTAANMAFVAAATANAAKNSGMLSLQVGTTEKKNQGTQRRNQGGRRPTKQTNMSPEEEEKRRIRRERNKLAAARCRKRRVDQTNDLLDEVAILEKKREVLQKDIENLNTTKRDLEYLLEAHRPTCQKIRQDLLTVSSFGGLIAPAITSNTNSNSNINELDPTLSVTGRSGSPLDLKPVLSHNQILDMVQNIKNEPIESIVDSNSQDHDQPPSPKRILLSHTNPMIPPPLPNVATISNTLTAATASLNTPVVTTAPISFASFGSANATLNTLNTLNALNKTTTNNGKQRPNSLPTMPRNHTQNLALSVDGKPQTDINGIAIQTPSTGMFNFDSLMAGGTGLTPVSGPLVPTCSSQNKHPLELTTPTSEPSKLVSL